MKLYKSIGVILLLLIVSCKKEVNFNKGTFGYDLNFINKFQKPIVLSNENTKILISPKYQGRVLTSTSKGLDGRSYGWLNYKLIERQKLNKGGNGFGGEDRFWLAPIGSKYSLYYNGKTISNENWYVPEPIDIKEYKVVNKTEKSISFKNDLKIKNNVNTTFNVELNRQINLFSKKEIENELKIKLPDNLSTVGFQSVNSIKNNGEDWKLDSGIIAPWILGMFPGNSNSIAIFPFKETTQDSLKIQKYLEPLSNNRLKIIENVVCYKTDGSYRSKIGLRKENVLPIFGNYNANNKTLTIITFSFNSNGDYLSCNESEGSEMFNGDVVNSYNNSKENEQATFFELETAASGVLLKKGEQNIHTHNTFHFEGEFESLDSLSEQLLGISLKKINF